MDDIGATASRLGAVAEGEPCVAHVGEGGAGHFVKMVHNGIEYADMQLIAEAYELLRARAQLSPAEIGDVFAQWNQGELESYLIEISADILRHTDPSTEGPFVDVVHDAASAKGTGAWTVESALKFGVPTPGIAEAVFTRSLSTNAEKRSAASSFEGPASVTPVGDVLAYVEDVRQALLSAKIVTYSQGMDLIAAGAHSNGWDTDLGQVARIWRGGCIIRARFLDRIAAAYGEERVSPVMAAAPYFSNILSSAQGGWRAIVADAAISGLSAPAFASSLAYYDAIRSRRLPTALVQAQRDYFGAHTYRRVDRDGAFHTEWSAGRTETRVS